MNYAYFVCAELTEGDFPIAVFWDREAALDFAMTENDAIHAAYVRVETIPLVDHYGFPCRLDEITIVSPWIATASVMAR